MNLSGDNDPPRLGGSIWKHLGSKDSVPMAMAKTVVWGLVIMELLKDL